MTAPKLFDLTGKTALVTGSSDGLGLGMARGLAEAGAAIVLNGRDERKLAAAEKAFAAAGHRVSSRAFDVADEARSLAPSSISTPRASRSTSSSTMPAFSSASRCSNCKTDEWRRVVEIHLTGSFQVGREAARRMIARGRGGKIINIASLASEVARATISP